MPVKSLLAPATEMILEEAIFQELSVSNVYKHVANQLQRIGFFGAAKYFLKESAEELNHYQKLAEYINDRGSVAHIPDIPSVVDKIATLRDALELAYSKEVSLGQFYEKWYSNLMTSDVTTAQFLLQYLEIQRTSIGEYGDLISRLDRADGDASAVLLIDQELGE